MKRFKRGSAREPGWISLYRYKTIFSWSFRLFGYHRLSIQKRVPIKHGKCIELIEKAFNKGEIGTIYGVRFHTTNKNHD